MKTKKISFTEYAYVLHAYPATVEISMEDFEKLEIHQKNIQTIEEKFPSYADMMSQASNILKAKRENIEPTLKKYPSYHDKTSREVNALKAEKENIKIILEKYGNSDYDCSEPIYDETYTDSYEYDGEV